MRAPQGVLPELTSFTPARLIGQTEHMATPTQGGASCLSPETRSGRKPPEPRSYYQAPEPNAGESSSAGIKTQPFRETLIRRESKQCCFSASPHTDSFSACLAGADSHVYSYGNCFPAKCDIWILSHCFSPARDGKHPQNIVDAVLLVCCLEEIL